MCVDSRRRRAAWLCIRCGCFCSIDLVPAPVVFSAIKPEDVRVFVADCQERYTVPSSSGVLTSALSGYFRFRATCGDQVHGLIGVLSRPANWQLASLPKALNGAEVERLLGALGQDGPSVRRANAMVRCAPALGLRSSEVANLGLDDIDWSAGTVTLRRTKGGREDVLPLPVADRSRHCRLPEVRTPEDDQPVGVRASRCTTRPIDQPRSRAQDDPTSLCPGWTAVHSGTPSAPHYRQSLTGGREFAQGGGGTLQGHRNATCGCCGVTAKG
jgi:Phage integrase family